MVKMPQYLSGQKDLENLTCSEAYYDLNNDKTVNLLDVFALIAHIVTEQ